MMLTVNGCELFVEESGPKNARAMLTLHSPAGGIDSRSLRSVFGAFADRYRVVFFDLRGAGRSEEKGNPSFQQLTADIEELRKLLGLGEIIVTGGSGGGFLALEYAIRYPKGLCALVLRGTGPRLASLEGIGQYVKNSGLNVDWDRFNRYWTGHCLDDEDMRKAIEEISTLYAGKNKSNPLSAGVAPTYWHFRTHNFAMQEQANGWDVTDRLGEIVVPTLIVHGDRDWVVPLEHAKILNRRISGSRLEVFGGCGHSPQLEEKDRFVKLVNDFLEEKGLS